MGNFTANSGTKLGMTAGRIEQTGDFTFEGKRDASGNKADVTIGSSGATGDTKLGNVLLEGSDLGEISLGSTNGTLTMGEFNAASGTSLTMTAGSIAKTTSGTGNITYEGSGAVTINATGTTNGNATLGAITLGSAANSIGTISLNAANGNFSTTGLTVNSITGLDLDIDSQNFTNSGALTYGGGGTVTIDSIGDSATLGDVILTGTNGAITLTAAKDLTIGRLGGSATNINAAASGTSLTIKAGETVAGDLTAGNIIYQGVNNTTGNVTIEATGNTDLAALTLGANLGIISLEAGNSSTLTMGEFNAASGTSLTMTAGSIAKTTSGTGNITYEGSGNVVVDSTDSTTGTGQSILGDISLTGTKLGTIAIDGGDSFTWEATSIEQTVDTVTGNRNNLTYEGSGAVTINATGTTNGNATLGDVILGSAANSIGTISLNAANGNFSTTGLTVNSITGLDLDIDSQNFTNSGALTYGGGGTVTIDSIGDSATLGDVILTGTNGAITLTAAKDLTIGRLGGSATNINAAASGTSLTIKAGETVAGDLTAGNIIYQGVNNTTGNVTIEATGNTDLAALTLGANLGIISLEAGNSSTLTMGEFNAASGTSLTMTAGSIAKTTSGTGNITYEGSGNVVVDSTDSTTGTGQSILGDISLTGTKLGTIAIDGGDSFTWEATSIEQTVDTVTGNRNNLTYEGSGAVTINATDTTNGNATLGDVILTGTNGAITLTAAKDLTIGRLGGSATNINAAASGTSLTIKAGETVAGDLTAGNIIYQGVNNTTGNVTIEATGNTDLAALTLGANLGIISLEAGNSSTLTMGEFNATSGAGLTITAGAIAQRTGSNLTYNGSNNVTINATAGNASLGNVNLTNATGLTAISITSDGDGSVDTRDDGTLTMGTFTANSGTGLTMKAGSITVGGALAYEGSGITNITATTGDVSFGNDAKFSGTNLNISAANRITYANGLSGTVRNMHLTYDSDANATLGRIDVSGKFDGLTALNSATLTANEGEYFSFDSGDRAVIEKIHVEGHARVDINDLAPGGVLVIPDFRKVGDFGVTGNLEILPTNGSEFVLSPDLGSGAGHLIIGGHFDKIGATSALDPDIDGGKVHARKITFQDGTFETPGALTILAAELVFGTSSSGGGVSLNHKGSITLAATGQTGEAANNWTTVDVADGGGDFTINSRLTINSTDGESDGVVSVSGAFRGGDGRELTTFSRVSGGDLLQVNLNGGALYLSTPASSALRDSSGDVAVPSTTGGSFTSGDSANVSNFNAIFLANLVQTLSVREAELSGLQTLSGLEVVRIVDSGVFAPDLTLYDVTGKGVALALSQCEEIEGCAVNVSEEELLQLMDDVYKKITRVEYELARTTDSSKRQQFIDESDSLRADLREFQRFSKSYRKDIEQFLSKLPAAERAAVALGSLRQRLEWMSRISRLSESGREKLGGDTGIPISESDVAGMRDAVERQINAYQDEVKRFWENQVKQQDGSNRPPVFSARVDAPVPQEVSFSQSPLFVIPGGATDNTFRAY